MERLPHNVLHFWKQMKAKDLELVIKSEAEPVFSRSPITGRCAYDGPGLVKPPFIRRKTPVMAAMVDDSTIKSDILGQPRQRCPTRQGLVAMQQSHLESIIRARERAKGADPGGDGLSAAAMEMARQQGKDILGISDDGVGALEALRRLREVADKPIYSEDSPPPQVIERAQSRASGSHAARGENAETLLPSVLKNGGEERRSSAPPLSARSVREELHTPRSVQECHNSREALQPETPNSEKKMAPPAQRAWRKDSSPTRRSSASPTRRSSDREGRSENGCKDVFEKADDRPCTGQSRKDDRPNTSVSHGSQEARPASAGGETRNADLEGSKKLLDMQHLLAPVTEVDESDDTNVSLLAALDIPPATPQAERRAYFLEGFSPQRLPPLQDGLRPKYRRQPPQVMVLETPPRSGGTERPASIRGSGDLGHFDPMRRFSKDQPSQWPAADKNACRSWPVAPQASPKPKVRELPKQPALPKQKPATNFYVGGKPIFSSK